ncbi:MAG: NAD-dependent epimerase/dehydratase family protein [Gammaproteobacteria bacterium]|nr:MAG: NAD-dependent epimerase/dehydratase family protein [Gammaproteobacteria bacterium]
MTTAVVTGAGGFIGRHLCARLVAEGWTVKVITRGTAPANTQMLKTALDAENNELVGGFLNAQVVYHLAGLAHEGVAHNNRAALQGVNVNGTVSVIKAAVEAAVPAVVWLSSIKVLGDVSDDPFRPEDPYRPGNAYAKSKMAAELALAGICTGSTRVAIVRPPLVYGAGVRGNYLRMLHWVARGIPLPLAHATALRSMVSAANLCDLLVRLSQDGAGVFHVADSEDMSVSVLLAELAMLLGHRLLLFGVPPKVMQFLTAAGRQRVVYSRLFDPLQVDQSATREALGWHPPFTAREQMAATVEWFQQQR